MAQTAALAPGIPADYYDRIFEIEERHWWFRGMRSIAVSLLGDRWRRPGTRLLDAGCGTGGFIRFALDAGAARTAAGVDLGSAAIALAGQRVPEALLEVAPLDALPFDEGDFDLVVCSDVLQHVPEQDVSRSLGELRRVVAPEGAILLRTNGSRRLRVERDDWRAYDASTLRAELARAGLRCARLTYADMALSLLRAARGSAPHAPTEEQHGIPRPEPPRLRSTIGFALLQAEARYLRREGRALPFGYALFALAVRA